MDIPIIPADGDTYWQEERPLLGAILQITAGITVLSFTYKAWIELNIISGEFTGIRLLSGVLILLTGVIALLRSDLSTILGIGGVFLSILSVRGMQTGLLIGLFIAIVGSNLLIAWQPTDSQSDSDTCAPDLTETKSGLRYSWQEEITIETEANENEKEKAGLESREDFGREQSDTIAVNTRLEDALERVAHGAVVSFPSILFGKGLSFVTTSILTNGFGGSSYGLWILAKKLVSFLRSPTSKFLTGLKRFLPTASKTEQDIVTTVASLLVLGPGIVFGAVLFLMAPFVTQTFDFGYQFQLFVRIYAVWFPGSLLLITINSILQALEEVEALNLLFRFVFPLADLVAVGVGVYLFHDFVVVVVGQILIGAFLTFILTGWLIWRGEFSPRIRGATATSLRSRYVLYSLPLVGRQVVNTLNSAGFYLLIPVFLSSVAAGVLAVGGLVSSLVLLPLTLNNQFIDPVVADLHEGNDQDALVQLYQITSRLVLVGSIGMAIPLLVYRGTVMSLFGPTFVEYSSLLPLFILAKLAKVLPGSDGIILKMTDRERAVMFIDIATALFVLSTAIPLTMMFGLWGLVVSFLAQATVSNGLQLFALYHLNGYHPFTRLHMKPLLAAGPFLLSAFAAKLLLSGVLAPLAGTLVGMAMYGMTLYKLGFTTTERRLAMSLLSRYRGTLFRIPCVNSK